MNAYILYACLILLMSTLRSQAADIDTQVAACDSGDADACLRAGRAYANGNSVKLDWKAAFDYYKKACDGGNGAGCSAVGVAYYFRQEFTTAEGYFQKALSYGDVRAHAMLGHMYKMGQGVPQSAAMAVEHYQIACDGATELGACMMLGSMYEQGGNGVTQDHDRAQQYLRRACADGKGVRYACELLMFYKVDKSK